MEKNTVGKRGKHSGQPTKRTKHTSDNIENSNEDKFVKACKQVSQNAYYNYNKRLKLLSLPYCNTCIQSSTEPSEMSQELESFKREFNLNMWYEALETCYYSITPTQYLPANVLLGIVEIILNGRENISTQYSMVQIINKCQQILSYHFNMHPPCDNHSKIMNCYKTFLTQNMEVKEQKYSKRNDFGYTDGIIKYCFNRLEYEMNAKSNDDPLYSTDEIDFEYNKIFKEGTTNSLTVNSIHRLNWEQQNYQIFEMLNRTERINRLMATLYSLVELIQFDIYDSVRNKKVRDSFLYVLFEIDTGTNQYSNKLGKQIMEIFAYLIHLDYPDDHIKTMSLWLNALFEVFYFTTTLEQDFPLASSEITNLEAQFYDIIKKLPPQSIIKILERIEPPYIKYIMSRRYFNDELMYDHTNVIDAIYDFIQKSYWENFPKNNEHFIKNEINQGIEANDILKLLSQICMNANFKCNEREDIYKKFDENCLSESEMTQNDVIKLLYISLEALLDAFNVRKVHDAVQGSTQEETPVLTSYHVTTNLEIEYKNIYRAQKNLIELLQQKQAAGELPKFLECLKIIYI
ncbi:unnamed protein product, partial [Brenthis ino]